MKHFTIERTAYETYTNLYTVEFDENDAKDLTNEIKKRYQVPEDFEVTLEDMQEVMKEGYLNGAKDISLQRKEEHYPDNYSLSDYVRDYMDDIIWSSESDYLESDLEDVEDEVYDIEEEN